MLSREEDDTSSKLLANYILYIVYRIELKVQCHRIFDFWFFSMNQFPPSLYVYH